MGHGDLNNVNAEERRVGIGIGIPGGASREFLGLANHARAGDIDIYVLFVLGVDYQGVGVRSPAALHRSDLSWIAEVSDVEDADAAKTIGAGRRRLPRTTAAPATFGGGRGRRRWGR